MDGLSNVTTCVESACPRKSDVEDARTVFQDLCVVYVANSTQPAEAPGE